MILRSLQPCYSRSNLKTFSEALVLTVAVFPDLPTSPYFSGIDHADRLANVAQIAIVIFAGAIGLQRMGLAPSIVNVAFSTLLGGIGLAASIAFGWGGRDAAKRLIDRYIG